MQGRPFVLVITGQPGAGSLTEAIGGRVAGILDASDGPAWLGPGDAFEITFHQTNGADALMARDRARAALVGAPLDVLLITPEQRRKRLLVADMESTIIAEEMLDELADHLGLRETVSDITDRAMRGELDFETALNARVALLAGLDAGVLLDMQSRITLTPGATQLIATMRAHGAFCALISGGFTAFTEPVATRLGFDAQRGNRLAIEDGKLVGRVLDPILGRDVKRTLLEQFCREQNLTPADAMAVGDGANDIPMLKAAGLAGVAFRPKPIVAADVVNSVRHGDLTALLYLQGYRRDEFAV